MGTETKESPNTEFLTICKASKRYGLSVWTLHKLVRNGEITAYTPTGIRLLSCNELDDFIRNGGKNTNDIADIDSSHEKGDTISDSELEVDEEDYQPRTPIPLKKIS